MALKRYEATVTTGLESIAAEECKEKLGVEAKPEQGRIAFASDRPVEEVLKLKGVDNVYTVISDVTNEQLTKDQEDMKQTLALLVKESEWTSGLEVWMHTVSFTKSDMDTILNESGDNTEIKPKFRVTCNRVGDRHCFTSMEAASQFGGQINERFHWPVSMKEFDVEVMLNIRDMRWQVLLALTRESLHKRNLIAFGPTTLRSTICYNMLRLADIKPGDILCDPMCGSGALPLEAAVEWPFIFSLAAENHFKAMENASKNMEAVRAMAGPNQVLRADVTRLPFKQEIVDIFVTDLPFGKRIGSKIDNRTLYPSLLREMARTARRETGRAVLLTQDKKNMLRALEQYRVKPFWRKNGTVFVKVGGICAYIYCLLRTEVEFN
jgi:23S rRNA G2445 N2-methylase RlmL